MRGGRSQEWANASGTNASATVSVWLPEPRMADASAQVASSDHVADGTSIQRTSPGAPSAVAVPSTRAPRTAQSAWLAPLTTDQRPSSRYPPGAGVATPEERLQNA